MYSDKIEKFYEKTKLGKPNKKLRIAKFGQGLL